MENALTSIFDYGEWHVLKLAEALASLLYAIKEEYVLLKKISYRTKTHPIRSSAAIREYVSCHLSRLCIIFL